MTDEWEQSLGPCWQHIPGGTAVKRPDVSGAKRFQRVAAKVDLPVIRFHDLRHTAATILLSKGVHVMLVSEMLGHSTITLTLDTYSHVSPAMHSDAAAAMDTVFSA